MTEIANIDIRLRGGGITENKEDIDDIVLIKNIEEVFEKSDYISIHIPLLDNTRNLIGEKLLSLMKKTAYIVNTARGGIINEKVLIEKLKDKDIAGAALDVFENEPVELTNELIKLDNVILTPHSAALTRECTVRVAKEAAIGVVDYLEGRIPKFIFNK